MLRSFISDNDYIHVGQLRSIQDQTVSNFSVVSSSIRSSLCNDVGCDISGGSNIVVALQQQLKQHSDSFDNSVSIQLLCVSPWQIKDLLELT
jgi:hypothetical protein